MKSDASSATLRLPLGLRLAAATYPLLRSLLFRWDAETAHVQTLRWLSLAGKTGLLRSPRRLPGRPVECMGLTFPNPVGLAAGLDKDAEAVEGFGAMGFGFLEVGTLTPQPQAGNPPPRLFRLLPEEAIINRMGFNNHGVDAAVARLQRHRYTGVLGVNIGKNKATPNEQAFHDYLYCLEAAHPVADYLAVNFSSPNTPGLRELQGREALLRLVGGLRKRLDALNQSSQRSVPLAVKIAPDLSDDEIATVAHALKEAGADGVIATNTTLAREAISGNPLSGEAGGLSGRPLTERATEVIACLRHHLGPDFPLIGVGGILNGSDARAKQEAGAHLIQLYTGFIYRGAALVKDCLHHLA
ncbi:MAG: quinone-dependent dihydroorotate dehydrogenase [Verrucomicrobiota bacterium]